MRILCVEPGYAFSVADVHRGWVNAFRALGHEVVDLNLNDRLDFYLHAKIKKGNRYHGSTEAEAYNNAAKGIEVACYEFWPDLVFITSAFFVPEFTLKVIQARGHKVVIFHTESPYEDDRQLTLAPYADLNLLNDPTNLERFRQVARAEYQWHCYDPAIHHPRAPQDELKSDFCFVGTGYPSRIEFLEKVDWTGVDVALAGTWSALAKDSPLRPFVAHDIHNCVDNDTTIDLYGSTKLSANLYRTEAQRPELSSGWSMGPREVELAASEVPFLRQRRGESDEVMGFLPSFETPAEFSDILRQLLADDDERGSLAARARESIEDRTFINSAERVLTLL